MYREFSYRIALRRFFLLFLKKKKQKDFYLFFDRTPLRNYPAQKQEKVFWFFFTKKNRKNSLRSKIALTGLLVCAPLPGVAQNPPQDTTTQLLGVVRAADLRLASIGYRLATANAPLCDRLEPGTGLQLHSIDAYTGPVRDAAKVFFNFVTPVAVEGVVPGSPAEQAGIHANDALRQIGPIPLDTPAKSDTASTQRMVQLHADLSQLPPTAPLTVERVARAGEGSSVTFTPVPACRTRFELQLDGGYNAAADGTMVQIGAKWLDDFTDDELAALVAHELSHNILHHRDRLEAQGVHFGMLSGLGGNVKYFRQTETEADLLSVYLLANAGYDPKAAVRLWEKFGKKDKLSFLRDRSHPGWQDRQATVEQEAERVAANPTRPLIPPLLATRDQPLDGNWQALLVRHK